MQHVEGQKHAINVMGASDTMKRLLSVLCLCAGLLPPSANALEISYSTIDPIFGISIGVREGLVLRGEIVPGDYRRLLGKR